MQRFKVEAKPCQRPRHERPRRQLGLQSGMLPWPVTTVKDFAGRVDFGPELLGAVSREGRLLQKRQPAAIPNVVLPQDSSPQVHTRWA
jgi:hypothetical protein